MRVLEKYLFRVFSSTFFPIFLTLFIVTSIIFLVKIATLTSIVQINFIELLQLYSYSIPTILFYTLPISYFIGLTVSISKLSSEYETIIITSFGLNPSKLLRLFFSSTLVISILLLIISLGLIPKAKYLKEDFLNIKQQEAQFNIKPSEYGQRIGSWLIYVENKEDNHFKNITLLQLEDNKDTIISSNLAHISNKDNIMSINLNDGKSFSISNSIKQVNFDEMILSHAIPQAQNIKSLNDVILYWDDRQSNLKKSKNFTFNILISIFPLISLFLCIIIGYFNPRYNKNRATMLSTFFLVVYVILANQGAKVYPNLSLMVLPIIWFITVYLYYRLTTKKLY